MAAVRVKGLKKVRSKGRVYYYHRKTMRRIEAPYGTPAFFLELEAADKSIAAAPKAIVGTLGSVIDSYKASRFYTDKRDKTKISYDRALEILEPLRDMPVAKITSGFAADLRDRLAQHRGRWITNYTLMMLSILMDRAREKDLIGSNPIEAVARIPKGYDAPRANRPWRPEECRVVLEAAPLHLRVPIGLAMLAGFRKEDTLTATKSAIRGDLIQVRTSKRGKDVRVPIHPELAKILAEAPAHEAMTIAATMDGERWTESGFNTVWRRLKAKLEAEGKIDRGLTIHGLRHTLATRLKEAGAADDQIADLLGQDSLAMARHYSRDADTSERDGKLIRAADVFGKNKKRNGMENPG